MTSRILKSVHLTSRMSLVLEAGCSLEMQTVHSKWRRQSGRWESKSTFASTVVCHFLLIFIVFSNCSSKTLDKEDSLLQGREATAISVS